MNDYLKQKKVKRVLVIGNGFDLNLGCNTSYYCFANNYFNKSKEDSLLHDYLKSRFNSEKRWYDFESELLEYTSNPQRAKSIEEIEKDASYFLRLRTEIGIYMQLNRGETLYCETEAYVESNPSAADQVNPVQIVLTRRSLAKDFISQIASRPDYFDRIISFNYTHLPNSIHLAIGDVFSHDKGKTEAVYACVCERFLAPHLASPVILGVANSVLDDASPFSFLKKSHQMRSDTLIETSRWISEADELVVFGHSLGDSDFDYFKSAFLEVFNGNKPDKKVFIITKDNKSKEDIENQLLKMVEGRVGSDRFFKQRVSFICSDYVESHLVYRELSNSIFHYRTKY